MKIPPRITEAKAIAERMGADSVVILAFYDEDGIVSGASYGQTKAQCCAAAKWMERLIDEMDEGMPTPSTIDRKS